MQLAPAAQALFADRVYVLDSVDSTSSWLSRQQHQQPALCMAHQQTQGRGRRNKDWSTPSGNLALSLSLPAQQFNRPEHGISLVVALAVQSVIGGYGIPAQVKWPNDLLIAGHKCAGILLQIEHWQQQPFLVIGIGINNQHAPQSGTTSICQHASSVDNQELAAQITNQLITLFDQYRQYGFTHFRQQWLQQDCWYGQDIQIIQGKTVTSGRHDGVDEYGRLLVGVAGEVITCSSGEVSVRSSQII